MRRLDLADADIRVGHRQRPAAAVAGRAGVGPRAVRPDAQPRPVEMQDRAATRRHRVDRHHRRAHAHAGHLGLERALEPAGVQRDVGRGAAHVEADDVVQPGHRRGARGADDAAGRARQDRVLALEGVRLRQAAVRLHEIQPRAGQLAGHQIDVAAQDRRQVGVHHRGVAARHQAQQRADRVAGGDLGEAGLARQLGQAPLVRRVFPGVQQHDGAGVDAGGAGMGEVPARGFLVQRLDLLAIDADAAVDLHHLFVQHRGQGDRQVEQPRPRLVADAQRVGEAAVDHQQHPLALALQQRVGGDRGAHLHRLDQPGRDRPVERHAEHRLDAGDGGVAVAAGILAQQLVGRQAPVGITGDDVGEGAAAIDPELPLRRSHAGLPAGAPRAPSPGGNSSVPARSARRGTPGLRPEPRQGALPPGPPPEAAASGLHDWECGEGTGACGRGVRAARYDGRP